MHSCVLYHHLIFRETTTKSVTKSTITTTIKQTVWTKRPELGITNSKTNVENEESSDSSHVVRGVVIGLSLVALVTLGIVGLFWYQRMQRRRYCSQEFLLGPFINYVLRQKNKGHFINIMILGKFQCVTDQ